MQCVWISVRFKHSCNLQQIVPPKNSISTESGMLELPRFCITKSGPSFGCSTNKGVCKGGKISSSACTLQKKETQVESKRHSLMSLSICNSMQQVYDCRYWRIDIMSWLVVPSHPFQIFFQQGQNQALLLWYKVCQILATFYSSLFPLSHQDKGLASSCNDADWFCIVKGS